MASKRFVANLESVAAEQFDREMVIINFQRGTYFSLSGSAVELWQMLQTPKTAEYLSAAFAETSALNRQHIQASIATLLDQLLNEQCVMEVDPTGDEQSAAEPATNGAMLPFVAPKVEIFHDLKELIAVDPVHETDEVQGWPHRPSSTTK